MIQSIRQAMPGLCMRAFEWSRQRRCVREGRNHSLCLFQHSSSLTIYLLGNDTDAALHRRTYRKNTYSSSTTFVIGRAEGERREKIFIYHPRRGILLWFIHKYIRIWCEEYEDLSWKSERRVYLIKWPIMPRRPTNR